MTEALGNSVINELRTKYLDASKRRTDLERKLGQAAVDLTNFIEELNMIAKFDARSRESDRSPE